MYTVDDIHTYLSTGVKNDKRTDTFTEPAAAPAASTRKDLNELMTAAPVVDDTDGATTGEVVNTKTFWSLQSGNWGLKTGTATTITTHPAVVPKTGQIKCYDLTTNAEEVCDNANSEHDLQDGQQSKTIGVDHATPRFTKNVNTADDDGAGGGTASNGICDGTETCNGTVTDNSTGLIWLLNANCANATRNWVTALSDINATSGNSLNFNGNINGNSCADISETSDPANPTHQTDWRLPNVKELQSLIDFQNVNLALPTDHPFSSVVGNWHWSSTTSVSSTGFAWYVSPYNGNVSSGSKALTNYVWPVRGGQ